MTNPIDPEVICAEAVRNSARNLAILYSSERDLSAAILGLLATALEQEAKAQFKDPSKLKFFTTEKEE